MKVLFISSWYPNSVNHLKGIYVKKHAAAIHKAGVELEILALTVSPSKKLYEKKVYSIVDENGIKTHIIELNSKYYKLVYVNLFLQSRLLKKIYFKNIKPVFKPDLIHSNVLFPATILGYWLSKKEKLPHIITEHWSKVDKFMAKSLYASQGKKAYNSAKKITVVSEFLKQSISKHFIDKNKIVVVPNVVNTELYRYKNKTAGRPELVFTCIAHWSSPKRPDLIFRSLENFSAGTKKNIVLNVVGEGPLINRLKTKNWRFKVNYLGNKPPAELSVLLQNSDYFLHASDMETFSIVIAEALATGTPVLASNAGAIPELINDQNGLIVNNTVEDWEKGLLKLIAKQDFDHEQISMSCAKYGSVLVGNLFKNIYSQVSV